ncbi:unnamed protein product [Pieris macdunnoughi]|uniref:Uncharacterized protein n=1 Tax=Pieris macdunnoughi TaxID=345717 RepID=A0A821WMP3_9NEOP|nr:unnamed protein product [Pieris macdunnoughi]
MGVEQEPPVQRQIDAIRAFRNVSDDLLLVDLKTFVTEHRRLLVKPEYFDPSVKETKIKTLDLMKQAIYGTQLRLRDLDGVMERFKDNQAFQMAFLFYRLDQLIVDMRRIYTLALNKRLRKPMYQHIIWYEHLARKHVDVLYIVQFVIDTHGRVMKNINVNVQPMMSQ